MVDLATSGSPGWAMCSAYQVGQGILEGKKKLESSLVENFLAH